MDYPTYLIHYGIEGQRWGVRRFQNEDGTWTEDGLVRRRKDQKHFVKAQKKAGRKFDKYTEKIRWDRESGKKISNRRVEKAIKLGTKFRSYDYISKDPNTYLKARKLRAASAAKFGVNAAITAAGVLATANQINKAKTAAQELKLLGNQERMIRSMAGGPESAAWTKENILKENILKENILKENILRGNILKENITAQNLLKEKELNQHLMSKVDDFIQNGTKNGIGTYEWREGHLDTISNMAKPAKVALNLATRNTKIGIVLSAAHLGKSVAELAVEQHLINKMVKNHYKDSFEKARKETIEDLEKHNISKNLSSAKQSRIKSLIASGKSQEEVAKMLGVSTSTVNKYK